MTSNNNNNRARLFDSIARTSGNAVGEEEMEEEEVAAVGRAPAGVVHPSYVSGAHPTAEELERGVVGPRPLLPARKGKGHVMVRDATLGIEMIPKSTLRAEERKKLKRAERSGQRPDGAPGGWEGRRVAFEWGFRLTKTQKKNAERRVKGTARRAGGKRKSVSWSVDERMEVTAEKPRAEDEVDEGVVTTPTPSTSTSRSSSMTSPASRRRNRDGPSASPSGPSPRLDLPRAVGKGLPRQTPKVLSVVSRREGARPEASGHHRGTATEGVGRQGAAKEKGGAQNASGARPKEGKATTGGRVAVARSMKDLVAALGKKRAVLEEVRAAAAQHGREGSWVAKKETEKLAKKYESECEALEARVYSDRKRIAAPSSGVGSSGVKTRSVPAHQADEQLGCRLERFGPAESDKADKMGGAKITRALLDLAVKPTQAKVVGVQNLTCSPSEPKVEAGIPSLAPVPSMVQARKKPECVLWPSSLLPNPNHTAPVDFQTAWRANKVVVLSDDESGPEIIDGEEPQPTRTPRPSPAPAAPPTASTPQDHPDEDLGATACAGSVAGSADILQIELSSDENVDDDVDSIDAEIDQVCDPLWSPDPEFDFKNKDFRLRDGDPNIVSHSDKA